MIPQCTFGGFCIQTGSSLTADLFPNAESCGSSTDAVCSVLEAQDRGTTRVTMPQKLSLQLQMCPDVPWDDSLEIAKGVTLGPEIFLPGFCWMISPARSQKRMWPALLPKMKPARPAKEFDGSLLARAGEDEIIT